jgi:amino acid transporter
LPGKIYDILSQVLVLLFFALMAITPLVIVVLGIVNLRRDKLHQGVIILQAVAALAVWAILSFVIFIVFMMVTFEPPTNKVLSEAIYTGGILIYFLVSAVLIFWTRRMTKRMPAMGLSC